MIEERGFAGRLGTFLSFAGPATLFFVTVIALPFAYGLFLTFTDWDGISSGFSLVGLATKVIKPSPHVQERYAKLAAAAADGGSASMRQQADGQNP